MSSYFTHLATRIANPTMGVRPRLGARFEPRQGTGALAAHSLEISVGDEEPSVQQENDKSSVSQPAVETLSPPPPSSPLPVVAESPITIPSNGIEAVTESVRPAASTEVRSQPISSSPLLKPEVPTSSTAIEPTTVTSNPKVSAPSHPLSPRLNSPECEDRPHTPVDDLPDPGSKPTESMATEPLFSSSDLSTPAIKNQISSINTNSSPPTLHGVSNDSVSTSVNQETHQITAFSMPQPSMAEPRPGILNAPVVWTGDTIPNRSFPQGSPEQVSKAPLNPAPAAEISLAPEIGEITPTNNRPAGPPLTTDMAGPIISQPSNLGNQPHPTVALPTIPQTPIAQTPVLQPTEQAATTQTNNGQPARLAIVPRTIHQSPLPDAPMVPDAAPAPVKPTVNVSIGRIEVRMTSPPKPQRARSSRPATSANVTSLSNYLRQGGQS